MLSKKCKYLLVNAIFFIVLPLFAHSQKQTVCDTVYNKVEQSAAMIGLTWQRYLEKEFLPLLADSICFTNDRPVTNIKIKLIINKAGVVDDIVFLNQEISDGCKKVLKTKLITKKWQPAIYNGKKSLFLCRTKYQLHHVE